MADRLIILASSSTRRKALLDQIRLKCQVVPAKVVEDMTLDLPPRELVEKLSITKARVVAAKHPDAIVIAADTVGVRDGEILGKPHNPAAARQMLKKLSGRAHLVITGFTIIDGETGKTITRSVETTVYFRKLANAEIKAYVQTGEPLDKAGAYAIQGCGAVLVERIDGDYYNVIGLPLSAVVEGLREVGVETF